MPIELTDVHNNPFCLGRDPQNAHCHRDKSICPCCSETIGLRSYEHPPAVMFTRKIRFRSESTQHE